MTTDLINRLAKIVGSRFVSGEAEERYLYSMDPGTMPAAAPDAVVMPANTEEVQEIVRLANELKGYSLVEHPLGTFNFYRLVSQVA